MMKIGAIVQARMSSTRLPGKVLCDLNGKPMLEYLMERLQRCRSVDSIIVATSGERSDEPIADFCHKRGIAIYRGDLDDVAGRFLAAAKSAHLDAFVRVNADSPLLDQKLVDDAVKQFSEQKWDMVTNAMKRSFPKGQSVEVLRVSLLESSLDKMTGPADREHVTQYFYRNASRFRIFNIESEKPNAAVQLSVDAEEDRKSVSGILSRMTRPHWEYDVGQIIELLRNVE